MERFKKLLTSLTTVFSGMILSSLWIQHNDHWQIHLPIVLICISLKMALDE